jgi:hypothetical protein
MGLPLTAANGSNTFETKMHLTYAIYWDPRPGGILPKALQNGHAAIIIDSYNFNRLILDDYVSWMGSGGSPFKATGDAQTYDEDMQEWGGAQHPIQAGYRVPTRWVAVQGLNQKAMTDAWRDLRGKQGGAHFKLIDKNCATVAARILKAGGGDRHARGWKTKNQLIWWPTDVIHYAESMGQQVYRTSNDNQPRFTLYPG